MIIFPAVDLPGGKAVRLTQGLADQSTVHNADPVAAALDLQARGAEWLHLIDLDGAFQGKSVNSALVAKISAALDIPIELGGGVRDEDAARLWFDAGVTRLIIGTMALENPKEYARLCSLFPGKIGVSLDAVDGRLQTRGWVADAGLTIDAVLPRLLRDGTAFIIYTDIARDGMQTGVNLPMLTHLAEASTVPVVAAGGVSTIDDIRNLYPLSVNANLQGAISGRAIYEGTLDLEAAMRWIREQKA
ncbi:MAG: 1-(5-phosphoribosyl)-5-[(5-phosphoribosylamino)methylideneamino] imidazole-4-carboxamide isomerase [Mailhella sp.]|nr:1-(5-phosphoribosyl)-5-[(5-phosphoribosylamino)methylideneamino] imidazole-4-carboxamide isomerase [Mailhella sp.]